MSSTDGNVLKFLCGLPAMYEDICLVKSPFLKDIAAEGLSKFYQYTSFMTIEKPSMGNSELQQLLSPLSNFEYLFLLAQMEPENHKVISAAFQFFTGDKPIFINESVSIILGDPAEKRILTKDNFQGFQDLVSLACALKDPKEDTIKFLDSDTPQVRALKEKLLKGRKDRENAKRKERKKTGEKELELSDLVASLAIGTNSYNILNVWDLTYYAFQDQLKRMNWREEFDINTRASLAGAKLDKKKLSHWIKSMTFN